MKIILTDPPKGYSKEAEYRIPMGGEKYLDGEGCMVVNVCNGAWNPRIVLTPERWRAERGDDYFYVSGDGGIELSIDDRGDWEDNCFTIGNYYRTKEEAAKARDRVLKAYKGVE